MKREKNNLQRQNNVDLLFRPNTAPPLILDNEFDDLQRSLSFRRLSRTDSRMPIPPLVDGASLFLGIEDKISSRFDKNLFGFRNSTWFHGKEKLNGLYDLISFEKNFDVANRIDNDFPQSRSVVCDERGSKTPIGESVFLQDIDINSSKVESKTCCPQYVLRQATNISFEMDIRGFFEGKRISNANDIYLNVCTDQEGSRFIQKRLESATFSEICWFYNQLRANIYALCLDLFGNYVIQKLLERLYEMRENQNIIYLQKHYKQSEVYRSPETRGRKNSFDDYNKIKNDERVREGTVDGYNNIQDSKGNKTKKAGFYNDNSGTRDNKQELFTSNISRSNEVYRTKDVPADKNENKQQEINKLEEFHNEKLSLTDRTTKNHEKNDSYSLNGSKEEYAAKLRIDDRLASRLDKSSDNSIKSQYNGNTNQFPKENGFKNVNNAKNIDKLVEESFKDTINSLSMNRIRLQEIKTNESNSVDDDSKVSIQKSNKQNIGASNKEEQFKGLNSNEKAYINTAFQESQEGNSKNCIGQNMPGTLGRQNQKEVNSYTSKNESVPTGSQFREYSQLLPQNIGFYYTKVDLYEEMLEKSGNPQRLENEELIGLIKDIFDNLAIYCIQLSTHMYGCRVIQKALECEYGLLRMIDLIKNNIDILVEDQNGNHVLQKAIELKIELKQEVMNYFLVLQATRGNDVCSDKNFENSIFNYREWQNSDNDDIKDCKEQKKQPKKPLFIFTSFTLNDVLDIIDQYDAFFIECNKLYLNSKQYYIKHRYGCRVIQRLFENNEKTDSEKIMSKCVLPYVLELLEDQYGNYVLQHIIVYTRKEVIPEHTYQNILNSLIRDTVEFREDKGLLNTQHCNSSKHKEISKNDKLFTLKDKIKEDRHRAVSPNTPRGKDNEINELINKIIVCSTTKPDIEGCVSWEDNCAFIKDNLYLLLIDKIRKSLTLNRFHQLCCHKFASNVLEKCIENSDAFEDLFYSDFNGKPVVVWLAMDRFANYVVQRLLDKKNKKTLTVLKVWCNELKKSTFSKHILAKLNRQQQNNS